MVCAFRAQGIEKKLRAQRETANLFVSLLDNTRCVFARAFDRAPPYNASLTLFLIGASFAYLLPLVTA